MQSIFMSALALLLGLSAAAAQEHHKSPYAGFEQRTIKALSPQQIADLRAGKGMSLALAAELNGYTGPLHVLELAPQLNLSPAQRAAVEELFTRMKGETVSLGEQLIEDEAKLDALFANRAVTPDVLASTTRAIGETQAALRHAHLKYHLATVDILTPHQLRLYPELRGYSGPASSHQGRH